MKSGFNNTISCTRRSWCDYEPVGSGLGVERFIGVGLEEGKRVDFGASDAAMSDAEIAKVERGVRLIPMTAGGVALAYNLPGLKGRLKLSRAAYTGIFLGTIKNWNDPVIRECNPGLQLPKLTIAAVARSDSSGTTFALTKHLDAVSPEWRQRYGAQTVVDWPGGPMRAKGNEGVATLIKHSEGSIGYVEFGFAQKLGLETAALENKAGNYIVPSFESAMAAIAAAELPDNLRVFLPDPEGPNPTPSSPSVGSSSTGTTPIRRKRKLSGNYFDGACTKDNALAVISAIFRSRRRSSLRPPPPLPRSPHSVLASGQVLNPAECFRPPPLGGRFLPDFI